MKIYVHIKDQIFEVECGPGRQRLQWLGDVAVHRYDHFYGLESGVCKGLKLEDETELDVNAVILDRLPEGTHVWVVLQEDEIAKKREELEQVRNLQGSAKAKGRK